MHYETLKYWKNGSAINACIDVYILEHSLTIAFKGLSDIVIHITLNTLPEMHF